MHILYTHPHAQMVHTLTFRHTQTQIYREKCTLTCMLVGTFTAHTHELRSEPLDTDSEAEESKLPATTQK